MFQPAELRNLCPEMLLCLEGKGFVQPLVPSPLHQPRASQSRRARGQGRLRAAVRGLKRVTAGAARIDPQDRAIFEIK